MLQQLLHWDQNCFIFLNSLGHPDWDPFFLTITITTIWIPLFLYFTWLAFQDTNRQEFYALLLTVAVMIVSVAVFGLLVKSLVARPRPYQILDFAHQIRALKPITGYSFFSGHAASSFAIVTLLWLFFKKQKPWFFIFFLWPLLFSFSRIYIGVHFPLDTLIGALIGICAGVLFYKGYIRVLPKCVN